MSSPSRSRLFFSASFALSSALLACSTTASTRPEATAGSSASAESRITVASDADCATLSRTQCMVAQHCTLTGPPSTAPRASPAIYTCRPAANHCENAVAQWDLPGGGAKLSSPAAAEQAIAACTSQTGCRYEPASCYCACKDYGQTTVPDGDEARKCRCYCAGGAPPSCTTAS